MNVDNDTLSQLLIKLDQRQDILERREDQHHVELITAITKLNTQMETILGGYQPGRLQSLEVRTDVLTRFKYMTLGASAVIGTLASAIVSVLLHVWKAK